MKKKILIQITLLLFLSLVVFIFFNIYYKKDSNNLISSKKTEPENAELVNANEGKDIIENIKYTSNNTNGDIIEILAKYGEPSLEIKNLMFLTNVEANIILKNKSNIKVVSDYANYNTQTFETTFMNNVKILREDEIIMGNELYLVFDQKEEVLKNNSKVDQNLIRISNDVIVKKPGYVLKADILEIDLITKNIKIHMNDKKDKVQAKSKIN